MRHLFVRFIFLVPGFTLGLCALQASTDTLSGRVRIWEEQILIPTYFTGPAEECPIFFRNKSYQGASRVSYPYPEQDNLTMKKGTREYTGLFLENEYIKLCILPEIGGRLMYATDKTNGYELFYRQQVIKPMLIGMLGAWISGGIEFCVFHHHRASTHMPVEYTLETHEDGSATIWIGEFEPRHRMRWNIGISLHPGRSWVRLDGTMINATENTHSILYWSNVATHVNEDYQMIFPPSTQYAVYHAKNSFAHWPITSEEYDGNEYFKNNIDVSWYKNHPEAGSFFAHEIDVGNLAGYDWGKHAGTMHVANSHIVKGAKFWLWGTQSTFDRKALTDEDGPYAELMAGAYSDNQPDYSWIKPYEVKQWQQTWYPLRGTEGMKFGNLDATVNLEMREDGKIFIAANTTKAFKDLKVVLRHKDSVLYQHFLDIDPANPFAREIPAEGEIREEDLQLSLITTGNKEIISYRPEIIPYHPELPPVVEPPGLPEAYESNELLYYAGERIRQFHHAKLQAEDYFLEALDRDPLDVRCNNAMGIICQENGELESAKSYFRKAISRLTDNWTRPRDCEPLYRLGVILKHQGEFESAIDTLYRAAWDYEFRSAAYYQLAQIYATEGDYVAALDALDNSLAVNGQNINSLSLKVSLLRLTGRRAEALEKARKILKTDRLSYYALNEQDLLSGHPETSEYRDKLDHLLRGYPENYLELASSYLDNGLYADAQAVLEKAEFSKNQRVNSYPTVYYYLGYLHHRLGNKEKAASYFTRGREQSITYCFPFRLESMKVFETALEYHGSDSRACYYLGNLLYDGQPEVAIGWWEKAIELEPGLAMAHRNLGWGYEQTFGESEKAIEAYLAAIRIDPAQPRFYAEIDRIMEDAGSPIGVRLELLTSNHEHVSKLQHALLREILVLVHAGEYERAIELMDGRIFYRQEDVNIIHDIHAQAHLLKGKQLMDSGDAASALTEFRIADTYPENQMIERPLFYEMNPRIYYYTGLACEAAGDRSSARNYFGLASDSDEITNEYLYYQAMALVKLDRKEQAEKILEEMILLGKSQLEDPGRVDFFAKFGEDLTENRRKSISHQILGLAFLGMGDEAKAKEHLQTSVDYDVNQLWARIYLEDLKSR